MIGTSPSGAADDGAGPSGATGAGDAVGPATDPTLATLVPARSRRRGVAVVAVGVLAVAVAWVSPHLVRPGLTSDSGWGAAFAPTHQALTAHHAVVRGWPSVTVHGVESGTAGARVLDAWLIPGGVDVGWGVDTEFADGYAALRDTDVGDRLDALELPATAMDGQEVQLVVLWELTDCAALPEDARAPEPSSATVQVDASTALGVRRTAGVEGADVLDVMWLEDAGACPA